MDTGARPGGRREEGLRTGPPSIVLGTGEERMEVRLCSGALPFEFAEGEMKEGMAVWLMEGWLWKRTNIW